MDTLEQITAAILVGGRGTRLRSRVPDRPKALAPVRNRPYLCYLLDFLSRAGIRNVILLTGYLAEQIESTFGQRYGPLNLSYSVEPTALGTGGAVRLALPKMSSSTLLVLNGDSYWDASLEDFWHFHRMHRSEVTLGLAWVDDASRFGRVHLEANRIARFTEKEDRQISGWINAGCYLLCRKRLEAIPPECPVSLEHDIFPRWVEEGCCLGFRSSGAFLDIGTPESYTRAARFFADRAA